MATQKGICKNFGECDLADSKEIQEADKTNFICEECGKPLHPIDGNSGKSGGKSKVNGKLIGIILAALILLGGIGFGVYTLVNKLSGESKPTVIKLDKKKITMKVGETIVLTPKVEPEGAKATFSFKLKKDSKSLIKVSNGGEVTALKTGDAVIRVKCEENPDISATCKITIVEDSVKSKEPSGPKEILIQKIAIKESSITMTVGEKKEISVTVEPENSNEQILISSSDDSVAELVIDDGKIVAKKAGTAIITLKGEKSGVSASVNIVVKKPQSPPDDPRKVKLSYGIYHGDTKTVGGKKIPHGHGTVTFTTTHRIVSSQDYIAHPGDRYEGEWRNGVISGGLGYWYHDGNTTGIRP